MSRITIIFSCLAGIIHAVFFLLESVFWHKPQVHSIFRIDNTADAETLSVFVQNQGYYNLFLALGLFAAVWLSRKNKVASRTLAIYICLFMIGAAVVLRFTMPAMTAGPLIQGVAPAIALLSIYLSLRNE